MTIRPPEAAMGASLLLSFFLVAAAAVASEPTGDPSGNDDIPNPRDLP